MGRLGWALLAFAVLVASFLGWGVYRSANAPPEVMVRSLQREPITRVLAVVGRVRNAELVQVKPEQPGKITEMFVDEGSSVVKGQPLAIVASDQPQAQIARAEADVSGRSVVVEQARRDFIRTQTLAAKGFASPAALEDRRATLKGAEASLASALAVVRDVSSLSKKYVILSPSAGIILDRPIDPGQVVDTSTVLFQLGAGRVEIWAEADEALADAVRVGQPAKLSASGTRVTVDGAVIEVSPRVDPATGGRIIRLVATGGDVLPVPGRSVDVNVIVDQQSRALSIPRSALLPRRPSPTVLVVVGDSVQERRVDLVDWPSPDAVVVGGLNAGDRLVLMPGTLKPGQKISAKDAPR